MKCFYHSADLDGHCSGAIVKLANPDCETIGMDYGEPFPWISIVSGELVIMVDFSLQPYEDVLKLGRSCDLLWIDHHKSAIEEYEKETCCPAKLDTNFAACELTWMHFFPDRGMPEAVHLLGRYDIWKHEETPGALQFQYGMRAFSDTRPDSQIGERCWEMVFAGKHTDKIINDGATILNYERNQNAKFMDAYGFECEFDGLRCVAANKGMGNSLVFDSKYDPAKHDAMLMFAWKGKSWTVSLYATKPEVDVSVICKARGGGGHKGAAGFQCAELPFLVGRG